MRQNRHLVSLRVCHHYLAVIQPEKHLPVGKHSHIFNIPA